MVLVCVRAGVRALCVRASALASAQSCEGARCASTHGPTTIDFYLTRADRIAQGYTTRRDVAAVDESLADLVLWRLKTQRDPMQT